MFVNFLKHTYVIIQRRIQGGYGGSSPPGSVKYMLFEGGEGGWPPPPKKKKKCKPLLGQKNLNIFKTMSSSQPLLNLSKYKSEDQESLFTLAFTPV